MRRVMVNGKIYAWVARDENGSLWVFDKEPWIVGYCEGHRYFVDGNEFPLANLNSRSDEFIDITFENSPVERWVKIIDS